MSVIGANQVQLIKGGAAIVDGVDLQVLPGELVGLVGPNGAGKSSLLSVLAGLEKPSSGRVFLHGKPLSKWSSVDRSRQLAWLEQSGPVEWPLTVERIVSLGRRPHLASHYASGGALDSSDNKAIEAALSQTDCQHIRFRDATTLSGGERTRMLLARALATEPQVLLADEPVAALDLGHQLQTMDVLRNFAREGRGCLVVLHDLSLAARYCDRLYLMCDGRFIADGLPSEVLTPQLLRDVYQVDTVSGDVNGVPWLLAVKRLSSP